MLNFYRQVITEAMQNLLIPDALKALQKDMIQRGEKVVLQAMEDKFWCEATMPPLRLQYVHETADDAPEVCFLPLDLRLQFSFWPSLFLPLLQCPAFFL